MTERDVWCTQNVWVKAPLPIARRVLHTLLEHEAEPDVIALQEWPGGRNQLLAATGAFQVHRKPRRGETPRPDPRWRPRKGWAWARPALGPTGPVGVRRDRHEILACYAETLTGPREVTPVGHHQKSVLPANRVSVTVFHDHELDETKAVIDYHLYSGVQGANGEYSRDPVNAERVAGHRQQRNGIELLTAHLQGRGYIVGALGDGNFDGLRLDGLTSAWAGRHDEKRGTHREGHRKIDDVFGPGRASRVILVDHGIPQIDHNGVIAVRNRTGGAR